MKSKILLLSLFFCGLFYSFLSVAQQKVGEFPISIPSLKDAILVSSSNEEMACVSQSNKQIEINFIAQDYSVKSKAIIAKAKPFKNIELSGAVLTSEHMYLYAFSPKSRTILCMKVIRKTGAHSVSTIKVLASNELMLSSFIMDGQFYYLTVPKNVNKLTVIKLDGENPDEIQYEVPMSTFYAALSKHKDFAINRNSADVTIQNIPTGFECDLTTSSALNKLYHENGKIQMTFDEPSTTHLVTFDPLLKTCDYKKLGFGLDQGNTSPQKQGNSFIYQNKLIRGTMSHDQLNVTILSLDSMTKLNNYNAYPEESIGIANTQLMEESGMSGSSNESVLKNSNQYFKHVLRGQFAISARSIDAHNIEMKIGGVEYYTVNRGGGSGAFGLPISVGFGLGMGGIGMGMGNGMMGMPYGGGMYPGYGYPNYGYGPSYTSTKTTYFKSVFNSYDYSHQDGYFQSVGLGEKMEQYESKAFRTNQPDIVTKSFSENKGVLGYYKKNGKRFVLVEFLK